jgi:hypothetical protein
MLLMDWWHKSMYEQGNRARFAPLIFVGKPESLLING